MSKSEMIAYIAGSLTTVVLCASVFVHILFCFKRKDFSKWRGIKKVDSLFSRIS